MSLVVVVVVIDTTTTRTDTLILISSNNAPTLTLVPVAIFPLLCVALAITLLVTAIKQSSRFIVSVAVFVFGDSIGGCVNQMLSSP